MLSRKQTVLGFIRFGRISSIKQVTDIKQLELLGAHMFSLIV